MRIMLIAFFSLAWLTACNDQETSIPDDQIAATVNGVVISQSLIGQFKTARNASNASDEQVLEELIATELLRQVAVESGLMEKEDVRAQLKFQENDLLVRLYMREQFGSINFTDEQLIAGYERQFGAASYEYKARHILLKTEDQAQAIIDALRSGADFASLAKEHSTGPSGANGGDLGWFSLDKMVPPFAEAVKSMNKGDISVTPVQTNFGYHVIQVDDLREIEQPSFEDMRTQVQQQMIRDTINDYINSLRENAEIEIK